MDKNIKYSIEALEILIDDLSKNNQDSFFEMKSVIYQRLYNKSGLKEILTENDSFNNNDMSFFLRTLYGLLISPSYMGGTINNRKYIEVFTKAKIILEKISLNEIKISENKLENKSENHLENHLENQLESKDIKYISNIKINNLYSIKNLELDNLSSKKEIYIVGENGDGKTLLLQGIMLGVRGNESNALSKFIKDNSSVEISITDNSDNKYLTSVAHLNFITDDYLLNQNFKAKNIFAYGVSRNQSCQQKSDEFGYLSLFDSCIDLVSPIEWLQKLDYAERSNENNTISLELAIEILEDLLNQNVKIEVSSLGVKFIERESRVSFKQLSAGYKGVMNITIDLLSRLSTNQPNIKSTKDFVGVVLIDEVELHLHPKWKYNFISKLRSFFPEIQFILTTHSPTVLLGASKGAVFYKIYKEEGEVKISNQIKNSSFTANTITSSPIFGLENVVSREYKGFFSSDDYVYEKIHKVIKERIKDIPEISEEEILKMINNEFNKVDSSEEG